MREKKPYFVVTYFTTAEAMATERICKAQGIDGKLVSAPRSVSADCGIAWRCAPENKDRTMAALDEAGIEVQGCHDLML